jgi:hypothetical protein
MERIFRPSHYLPVRRGFSYLVMPTAKTATNTPICMIRTVGVWCAISWNRILGSICYDDTIKSEVNLRPFTEHLNEDEIVHGYLKQDGATARSSRVSMTLLRDRTISRDIWPPRSPDLVICAVYEDNPFTILGLNEAIANFIRYFPSTELSRGFANKLRRVHMYVGVISNICVNV